MKSEAAAGGGITAPSIVHNVIAANGQPLDAGTKKFMESRFGYDFGNVQIHNDMEAHQSSASINALAYTSGNHIVFGTGQYQPDSIKGKKLLAHELTHVVQQHSTREKSIQRDEDKTSPKNTLSPPQNGDEQPMLRIELPEPLMLRVNGIGVTAPLTIQGVNGNIIDIGPYTGKKWIDFPLAALEALGIPILSYMAFHGGALTQYRGIRFNRVKGLSGGTSFVRNALHYGYIQSDETYLYGAPGSYMPQEYAGIPNLHIQANPMDIGTMIDVRYYNDPVDGHPNNPAVMFSLTSSFHSNPLEALVNLGGAFGHLFKGDLYSLPGVTHNYPDYDK
ncbi:MAG: DUF4157 domain-containing protein [Chitinophagaceae bacterium]|nr:DUF4157 domain-containing protein [Chitinophagaceae bacterium]